MSFQTTNSDNFLTQKPKSVLFHKMTPSWHFERKYALKCRNIHVFSMLVVEIEVRFSWYKMKLLDVWWSNQGLWPIGWRKEVKWCLTNGTQFETRPCLRRAIRVLAFLDTWTHVSSLCNMCHDHVISCVLVYSILVGLGCVLGFGLP